MFLKILAAVVLLAVCPIIFVLGYGQYQVKYEPSKVAFAASFIPLVCVIADLNEHAPDIERARAALRNTPKCSNPLSCAWEGIKSAGKSDPVVSKAKNAVQSAVDRAKEIARKAPSYDDPSAKAKKTVLGFVVAMDESGLAYLTADPAIIEKSLQKKSDEVVQSWHEWDSLYSRILTATLFNTTSSWYHNLLFRAYFDHDNVEEVMKGSPVYKYTREKGCLSGDPKFIRAYLKVVAP